MMDIVERLRNADWNDNNELYSMAADEITSLRQQLAVLQINNTKFLEISVENEQLKQQLAECQKERDELVALLDEDRMYKVIRKIGYTTSGQTCDLVDALLAKLGADKTGEVE